MDEKKTRRLLYAGAAVLITIAFIQWGIAPLVAYQKKLDSDISRNQKRLEELLYLEQKYELAKKKASGNGKFFHQRSEDFTLFAFLDSLASQNQVKNKIEFMRPSEKKLDENLKKQTVVMRLSEIRLSKLIPYLYQLETAKEKVYIERLTILSPPKNPGLLSVDLNAAALAR